MTVSGKAAGRMLGCKWRHAFAVVDPHVDLVDEYLELAEREGIPIVAVFETHLQALAVSTNGLTLDLDSSSLPRSERTSLSVRILDDQGLEPPLAYLRGLGVVPPAGSREAPTPAGELLDRYADYLRLRRGLTAARRRARSRASRRFATTPSTPATS